MMHLLFALSTARAEGPTGSAVAPALATSETEVAPDERPAPDAVRTYQLGFAEQLNVRTDPMLQGLTATYGVSFTVPRSWDVVEDPVLDLRFDHSSALDPHRSSLTVRVNDYAVATVRLDEDNAAGGRILAKVPKKLLQPYNRLELHVVQHVSDECEDPFDPSLWTRVSAESDLTIRAKHRLETPDLLQFPYPLLDVRGYGPMVLTLVEPSTLSPAEASALGRLGLAFGRLASYRKVDVQAPVATLSELETHGLVVGVVGADPLVDALVRARPEAGHGVVALVPAPHDPTLTVLVVAGADDAGLAKAVDAIVGQSRYAVLSGAEAVVSQVAEAPPPPLTDEVLPVPPRDRFTLDDLGVKDTTVRGFYAESLKVPLVLEGDARPRPGASLRLLYTHSELVDPRLSAIEVRLNGVVLRSRHLDSGDRGPQAMNVDLPAEVLEPKNELEIAFHLFPDNFDPCRRVSDRQLWATVFAASQVTIARDHYAMLPDLGLLRHRFWPFSLDGGGTTLALSDTALPDDGSAAIQVAAELGRTSASPDPSLAVRVGPAAEAVTSGQVIVLADPKRPHALWSALAAARKVTISGEMDRELFAGRQLLGARVGTAYGTVEAVLGDGDRSTLVLRASAEETVLNAARALVDPARLAGMAGNACVLPFEGGARLLDVVPQKGVGTLSFGSRARGWVTEFWGVVGLGVPLAALVATGLITAWARRRGGRT